jgi:ABC-type sugar transport system substrate-binding protein
METWKRIGNTFKATLLTVLVVGILVFVYLYFASYSEGYRAGVVYKLSQKGYVFKTYEGEMNTGNYVTEAAGDNNLSTKIWNFSVDGDQKEIVAQLENAVLKGSRVKLFYKERYLKLPWRGDTKYFIFKVEASPI